MKRKGILIISLLMILAMAMTILAGCGNKGEGKDTFTMTGEKKSDKYWEVTVTDYEVKYDSSLKKDCLIVNVKAKNVSDYDSIYNVGVVATATQDGMTLTNNGNEATKLDNEDITKSGRTQKVTYAFELNGYSQVSINFHSSTDSVKGKTLTFDVKDMQTDDAKDAEKEAEKTTKK